MWKAVTSQTYFAQEQQNTRVALIDQSTGTQGDVSEG